ncbi:MAG: hypothetical protein ACO3GZ_10815 [Ilumatobacteraceae bacterium]
MPARPQKPKTFVPTDVSKATYLATLVGRGQCGRNGRQGSDKRIEQRIARRQTSVRLRNFVCSGTFDCNCPACAIEPVPALKSGMYPIVACGGSHTNTSVIATTLQSWFDEAESLDAFLVKVARAFPDGFHVRQAIRSALKTVLEKSCETAE